LNRHRTDQRTPVSPYNRYEILANDSDEAQREEAEEEEQNAPGEEEVECGDCEGEAIKLRTRPGEPTAQEIEVHRATHVPFRAWCEDCVFGKAVDEPHRKSKSKDEEGANMVMIDYGFMTEAPKTWTQEEELKVAHLSEEAEAAANDQEIRQKGLPILVVKHRRSKYITAHMVPRKGGHPYSVKRLSQDIDQIIGAKSITLKSDQEKAILKLKNLVKLECQCDIRCEESPVAQSQSNGDAEATIRRVQGQTRTMLSALVRRYGDEARELTLHLPWIVRHAAALMNRFQIGEDGMTAHRRLRGKKFNRAMVEFGECIWYLKPGSKGKFKRESRWGNGIFLGIREESGEYIVGTEEGTIKCGTCRRKGLPEDRWNLALFKEFKGLPWEPTPGSDNPDLKSRIIMPEVSREIKRDIQEPAEQIGPYKTRITQRDLEKYGVTQGCPGCRATMDRSKEVHRGQRHTETCRIRIEGEIAKHEPERHTREIVRQSRPEVTGENKEEKEDKKEEPMTRQQVREELKDLRKQAEDQPMTREEVKEEVREMKRRRLEEPKPENSRASDEADRLFGDFDDDMDEEQEEEEEKDDKDMILLLTGKDLCREKSRKHSSTNDMDRALHRANQDVERIGSEKIAHEWGLGENITMDLSANDPEDGKPWDLSNPSKHLKAKEAIRRRKPALLIGGISMRSRPE
jgi:hypothetical protein